MHPTHSNQVIEVEPESVEGVKVAVVDTLKSEGAEGAEGIANIVKESVVDTSKAEGAEGAEGIADIVKESVVDTFKESEHKFNYIPEGVQSTANKMGDGSDAEIQRGQPQLPAILFSCSFLPL